MTKRAFCWALWKYGVHRPPRGSRYITDTLCSPPHFLFHILLLTYWFPKESLTYRFYNFRKQVLDIHVWELSEPPIWWSCLSGWTQDFFFYFSVPGLYSPAEMIDFGIIRTLDDPVTVSLNLVNTGYKPVHISVRQLASFIGSMEILASTCFSGIKTCNIP